MRTIVKLKLQLLVLDFFTHNKKKIFSYYSCRKPHSHLNIYTPNAKLMRSIGSRIGTFQLSFIKAPEASSLEDL